MIFIDQANCIGYSLTEQCLKNIFFRPEVRIIADDQTTITEPSRKPLFFTDLSAKVPSCQSNEGNTAAVYLLDLEILLARLYKLL